MLIMKIVVLCFHLSHVMSQQRRMEDDNVAQNTEYMQNGTLNKMIVMVLMFHVHVMHQQFLV